MMAARNTNPVAPRVTHVGNVSHVEWVHREPTPPQRKTTHPLRKQSGPTRAEIEAWLAQKPDPQAEPPKGFIRAIGWVSLGAAVVGALGLVWVSIGHPGWK